MHTVLEQKAQERTNLGMSNGEDVFKPHLLVNMTGLELESPHPALKPIQQKISQILDLY